MKRFLPYFKLLKPVRFAFVAALAFGVVQGVASGFGLPFATEKVFPVLFQDPNPTFWALFFAVTILPATFMVRGIAGYLNTYLMTYCGLRVLRAIQLEVYGKVQALPLDFLQRGNAGDLMARILGDSAVLQSTLTTTANNLIRQPITFVAAIGALLYFALQQRELMFVLFCLMIIPVVVVPIRFSGRRLGRKAQQVQAQAGVLNNRVQENLLARTEIRLFNLQDSEVGKFRVDLQLLQKYQLKAVKYEKLLAPSVEFVSALGIGVAIFYAARSGVTLESLVPLIVALFVSYQPLKSFGSIYAQFKRGLASLDRLEAILHDDSTLAEPDEPVPAESIEGSVEFSEVWFRYGKGPVLRNINEKIRAGEIVALVGTSGAGKTTFANLIPRLYDVQAGQVLVGGADVRDYLKRDLRANIAIVPQDPILFNDSVRSNILMGRPDAGQDDVERAAREAYAHEFIEKLPQGYDTRVGERGTRLSGGQKQRVALARAFLKDAPILILDEATSNLDSESEAMIQKALSKLVRGRTTLIIAHRFSTLKIAERILVFEDGRIIASGSNDELVASNERYRALYELQSGSLGA